MTTIDITGIDKVLLLQKLWENQKVASFFDNMPWMAPKWEAPDEIETYFDYHQGRAIKVNMSRDEVDPQWYDRDAGEGTFLRIVNEIRASM